MNSKKSLIQIHRYEGLSNLEIIKASNVIHSLPRHMHQSLCVGVIGSGSRLCIHKGTKHLITPGQVLVINPGEAHTCSSALGQPYDYQMICFPEGFLTSFNNDSSNLVFPFQTSNAIVLNDSDLHMQISRYISATNLAQTDLERQIITCDFITNVFGLYSSKSDNRSTLLPQQPEVLRIKEYLEENCEKQISMSELSALVNLSQFHLNRIFTRSVGIPPHAYQYLVRITKAKKLLRKGESVINVSLEMGFVDQSHFHKWFKKVVGITPGQYLKTL